MSELLEWDLIYRTGEHLGSLIKPDAEFPITVFADSTGTNVIAHVDRASVKQAAVEHEVGRPEPTF